ncbi:hypothetical protein [Calderihabitans maritimus]|uniref:Uncharacterized protein n=1 Tax=Calderihabitans maritimus TaxID=1246530 RepID=A0A1Z5HSU0_9FIRM|nr:hypothetical protein [Calderihabitans maritimus]GAW92584.1 hypothetical protein KKC1_17350 [Calderihabitans maritimus]
MRNYTVKHIFLLQLLIFLPIMSARTLHNLLYLVQDHVLHSHQFKELSPVGFYDFVRTSNGVWSKTVHSIVEDFRKDGLLPRKGFTLTPKGREVYYHVGSILNRQEFAERCLDAALRFSDDPAKANAEIKNHLTYRRTKIGENMMKGLPTH